MKKLLSCVIFASLFSFNVAIGDGHEMAPGAVANFVNPEGDVIGDAKLWQGRTGVVIEVQLSGLEPGKHAIHVHSIGTCEPDFKASGGHINVMEGAHGLLNPEGPDNGDLPNIYVNDDGNVVAQMFTPFVALNDMHVGGLPWAVGSLFDSDGSALVVHAQGDDHMSQPIGGAGGRVACGVIQEAG